MCGIPCVFRDSNWKIRCEDEKEKTMSLVNPIVQKWIDEGKQDPEAFWGRAAEQLPWFRKWDRVLDWTPPTFSGSSGHRRTWPTTPLTITLSAAGAGTRR